MVRSKRRLTGPVSSCKHAVLSPPVLPVVPLNDDRRQPMRADAQSQIVVVVVGGGGERDVRVCVCVGGGGGVFKGVSLSVA